jgi:hypothetical protein
MVYSFSAKLFKKKPQTGRKVSNLGISNRAGDFQKLDRPNLARYLGIIVLPVLQAGTCADSGQDFLTVPANDLSLQ